MKWLLVFSVLFFWWGGNCIVWAKQASTIEELVAMFDDSVCWQCHEEQHAEWEKSNHASPVLSSLKGMRNFIRLGVAKEWNTSLTKQQLLKCLDCHAPLVNYASEELAVEIGEMIVLAFEKKGSPQAAAAERQLARLTIGCTACHNIKATAISPGLQGEPIPDAVYGVKGLDSDGHETIETVALKRSLFCMQCHGTYTASDGETIKCNTISGSYRDAYISFGGGQTCQDCHMKEKSHVFPGGHDLQTVGQGLGLDVEIIPYRHLPGLVPGVKNSKAWVPSVLVNAFVQNRAGHRIPDG